MSNARDVDTRLDSSNRDSIEHAITEIWSSALGRSGIGTNDDFFDLGGTSLGLINVVTKMSERFAVPLDTSIVVDGATVSALAKAVERLKSKAS